MLMPNQFNRTNYSTKQATQNLYLTFLTSVLNINLTKYTVGQSDYFVSYPPKFGGTIREEYFSYLFNSGLGTIDTWSVFDNGRMSVCSIRTTGQVLYTQAPAGNIADATNAFFRQYKTFVSGSYPEDSSYLQQALTSVSTVNMQQSADKLSGDMELTVSPPSPSAAQTSIQWAYSQNNITDSMKNINLIFANNTIIWFGDTWNLYSVSNVTPISENKAESIAFNYAKSYNVIVESIQTPTASYVQVKPDWSNMTYEGELLMTPGLSLSDSLAPADITYPTNTTRDALTLYPIWQFILYFNKPIGTILGLEINVWGDSGEIAFCTEYGYLGGTGSTPTPQPTSTQSAPQPTSNDLGSTGLNTTPQPTSTQVSNETGIQQSQPNYPLLALIIAVTTLAIIIASHLVLRRRNKY